MNTSPNIYAAVGEPPVVTNPGPELPDDTLVILPTGAIEASAVRHAPAKLPAIESATDFLNNKNLSAPAVLVQDIINAATKINFSGSSKIGKTWILLHLALAVATGTWFLKWKAAVGRVLYINLEIHAAFFRERIQLLIKRLQLANIDNLAVWNLRGQRVNWDKLLPAIIESAKKEPYSLIIIDPIYKAMVGRSENSSTRVGLLGHDLDRVTEDTGATVASVNHFSKGNQSKKSAIDRLSGSGVFGRDADTLVTFTEHAQEGCYTVDTILRNLPPQAPFVVEWDFPVMVEQPNLDPEDLKNASKSRSEATQDHVLSLLGDDALAGPDWRKRVPEISKATFYRAVAELEARKKVVLNAKDNTYSTAKKVAPGQTTAAGTRETNETCETETSAHSDHTET